MPTSTPTKVIQPELKAISTLAASLTDVSSVLTVTTKFGVKVLIDFARGAATVMTAGVQFLIQISQKAAGNDTWRTLTSFVTDSVAAASIVTDGIEAAGQTIIETGATVPAINDIVFFLHGTLASSEWVLVVDRDVTGGTEHFHIADALTNTQPQQTLFTKAEQFQADIDLGMATRIRVLCVNSNQAIVWRCAAITLDSIVSV